MAALATIAESVLADRPVTSWHEREVGIWLQKVLEATGMPQERIRRARELFDQTGVNGTVLLCLDESELQTDLGLEHSITRKRVLAELTELRARVHREKLSELEADPHYRHQQESSLLLPFSARAQCKLINDPIHGHILLEPELVKIIDTPQFQRLRDLKQLGTAYFVYPGASHNRFEHSIGTCHLAGLLLQFLRQHQPELRITSREVLLVKIAGLCHDLGHGPFSHAFDNEFIPMARPGDDWSHEDASIMMLEDILESVPQLGLLPREVRFVKELINPSEYEPETFPHRGFLYDVVANARNSIDVDKSDYLARDEYNLGLGKSNFDHIRLMHHARVINNQICFHSKEVTNVYGLFQRRFLLHRTVYSHKVSKAIEYMIVDALLAADPVLRISDAIRDPKKYVRLSDNILFRIEHSEDPRLEKARSILQRLRRRDLYKLVEEALLPTDVEERLRYVTPEDICACQPVDRRILEPSDLRIHNLVLNYAHQDKNPVERVRFFTDWNSPTSVLIPEHKVSFMLPTNFQERWLRVYLKDTSPEKIEAARAATRAFFGHHECLSPGTSGLPYSFSQDTRHSLPNRMVEDNGLESLLSDDDFKQHDGHDYIGGGVVAAAAEEQDDGLSTPVRVVSPDAQVFPASASTVSGGGGNTRGGIDVNPMLPTPGRRRPNPSVSPCPTPLKSSGLGKRRRSDSLASPVAGDAPQQQREGGSAERPPKRVTFRGE